MLIGRRNVVEMAGSAVVAILIPGCAWNSEQSHRASLSLPAVTAAIARAKPLIASFDNATVTEPVGGHGLEQSR
jgi:hypothetical protein